MFRVFQTETALPFQIVCILAGSFFLFGCSVPNSSFLIETTESQTNSALHYARLYVESETEYLLGGQDFLDVQPSKIDCSGLVINCYKYALQNTEYMLPFSDAAVINFYDQWTVLTDVPRPGDIIFMGDTSYPTHMSLFVEEIDNDIYFIDSTLKEAEEINGVSLRHYPKNDSRLLSFAKLLITPKI